MHSKQAFFSTLLILISQIFIFAQTPLSYKISDVDNIPQRQIQFVFEGPDQLTWIASGRELLRYDADRAVNVKSISPSLALKNSVTQMIEFKDQLLLLVNGDSCLYQIASSGMITTSDYCIPNNQIRQVAKNQNDLYLLSIENGEHRIFQTNGKRLNLFKKFPSVSNPQNVCIYVDNTKLYYLNEEKLCVFDLFGNQLDCIPLQAKTQNTFNKNVMCIGKFQDKIIFAHPYLTGIHEADFFQKKLTQSQIYNINNFSVALLKFDDLQNAIVAWSDKNGFLYKLSRFGIRDKCLPDDFVLEDKTLQTLAGKNFMNQVTIGGYFGLRHISFPKQIFTNLLSKTLKNDKYLEDGFSMRGIVKVNDDLYLAREINSIYRYNHKTAQLDTLKLFDQNSRQILLKCTNDLLYVKNLDRLFIASCGDAAQNYLISVNPKTGKSTVYQAPARIQSMTLDTSTKVITCGFSSDSIGIGEFDLTRGQFTNIITKQNAANFYIRQIDDLFFIGTKNGLQVLSQDKKPIPKYKNLVSAIGNDEIYHISQDKNLVFIGSAHNGLFVLNTAANTFKQVNDQVGIKSNAIASVVVDDANFLWLATFNGLYLMDSTFKTIKEFTVFDGINHNEFNRYSYFKDDSRLYFGSINGILKVDVENLFASSYVKSNPIYLQKMVYFDRNIKTTKLVYFSKFPNVLTLKSHESNHRLSFGNRTSSEKLILRAQLSNEDTDWRYQDIEGYISINDLDVGKYKLRMQFKNIAGNWEEYDQQIAIERIQYFTEMPIFRLILYFSLFLAIGIYALNRYKQKSDYEKLRESIAHDLHDQLGSALTSISMKAQMLDKNSEDVDFQGIAADTKAALQLVRDTIWSVNPGNDLVEHLIDRCKDFAYNLLQNRSVEIKFLSKLDNLQKLNIKTRKELFLIFKEALTNIIKHANPSYVEVTFQQDRGKFELIIKNDGTAEEVINNDQGLSIGLISMGNRAKNIGGQINFESQPNTFKVHLISPLLYT